MRSVSSAELPQVERVTEPVRPVPPTWLVLSAFAAVYVVWGSTYLGIRIAVETIPPFLMAGSRFIVAGIGMYVATRLSGASAPTRQHWGSAAVLGSLLLLAGNGGVSWAEKFVPSGITALLIAAVPLWMVLLDWVRPQGRRPTASIVAGLVAGFAGVGMIVSGRDASGGHLVDPMGGLVLLFATITWAIGSVYSRYAPKPESVLLAISMQMIAGGAAQLLFGTALGEWSGFHLAQISSASAWSWVYLTLIGSLVGFTAYAWLLQVSTPAKVGTYAYVNPVIAVLLGTVFLKEPLGGSIVFAGALVLLAVVLISRKR